MDQLHNRNQDSSISLTHYDISQCLHQLFERQATLNPANAAIIGDQSTLSYGELNRKANLVAASIRKQSNLPGSFIAICLDRSADLICSILGILKAGCAYIPLNPDFPAERLQFIVKDASIAATITQHKHREKVSSICPSLILLDDLAFSSAPQELEKPNKPAASDDAAYVIYTSGTTGEPNGVSCHHMGVVNLLDDFQGRCFIAPGDICSWWTNLCFDVSVYEIFAPLLSGAALVIVPDDVRLDGYLLMDWLFLNRVTSAYLPPMMLEDYHAWVKRHPGSSPLRRLLTGVEPISEKLLLNIDAAVPELTIINGYGPTETTICATLHTVAPSGKARRNTPIGIPVQNMLVHLLDEDGRQVAPGQTGEIYISGVGVSKGYLNRPALNARLFTIDPSSSLRHYQSYRTGDLGYLLDDGNLMFAGRKDFQIKHNGYRIEPGEIEAVLRGFDKVQDAVVMLHEVGAGDQQLIAYVTCRIGAEASQEELQKLMRELLPAHMMPSATVVLDKFPMTANGKIDRRAFPAPELAITHHSTHIPARSELEHKLVAIWEKVLGVHPIGIRDDFFSIGGHSLLAAKLCARMREEVDPRITLSALFQSLTVESLALRITENRLPSAHSCVVCIQHGDDRRPMPPLFIIHMVGTGLKFCLPLIKHLGPQIPVYALSIHLFDWIPGKESSVEDLAKHYIEEIRSIQPVGPYLLLGISFGGLVAYEMARQMHKQNGDVRLLALLDTTLRTAKQKLDASSRLHKHREKLKQAGLSYLANKIRERLILECRILSEKLGKRYSSMMLGYYMATRRTSTMPVSIKEFAARQDNEEAARNYEPTPYDGKITLFRSSERVVGVSDVFDPLLGWGAFARGGIEVVDCPNDHLGMLKEPHVIVVAQKLNECISRALNNETHVSSSPQFH
ncbi:MAG: amino acid adenylation domain-containing protein [Chlorobiaceae bacterium]|nr:amino acid adenylation domain-containing protein [Chlorobiaceae bacterium]